MKKNFRSSLILLIIQFLFSPVFSQGVSSKNYWPPVAKETKPWTRWWWMGSAVDSLNLVSLIDQYSSVGFGGVEITPIYGVKDHDARNLDFLSPAWIGMLKVTVSEADKMNMGVDMNTGTGWPFGGPQITPQYAASRLIVQNYRLAPNETLEEKILVNDPKQKDLGVQLEALVARSDGGEVKDITAFVNKEGKLNWSPASGSWQLFAAFCGKTRQQVKRAAPGGEGYTMNHFSREALDIYLGRFDNAFENYQGIRAFFNDSYEVYNASWSPGFFDEFQKRRSYDLRLHLPELVSEADTGNVARVKSDYRQTMAELLLGNFTRPWTEWTHTCNGLSKNQAHGSPGNLIDLYAAVDIPECEVYGHSNFPIPGIRKDTSRSENVEPDPLMLKIATSAAHVTGKKYVSNETFTWLGEHFSVALSQCKPEVEEAFLAGINHVFYHGTTYSPADAEWPGWLFYASVNFAPSNTFWPHLSGLNEYITRCQSVLQSGKPDNEILVYWPVFDIWNNSKGMEMQLSVHNIREWLVYPAVEEMGKKGYSFDFISDDLLQKTASANGNLQTSPESLPYKVLIIPGCDVIPLETVEKALSLASGGALVIFQKIPADVPGLYELDARREKLKTMLLNLRFRDAGKGVKECKYGKGEILLAEDLVAALNSRNIKAEKINDYGLKYIRRDTDGGKYYFLVNHTASSIDTLVPLNLESKEVLLLDPGDGSTGKAQIKNTGGKTLVRVQLAPGETVFLQTSASGFGSAGNWNYYKASGKVIEIGGPWSLHFSSGGPYLPPPVTMKKPEPWTATGDSLTDFFSGTAVYSAEFKIPSEMADEYLLDLGSVFESARVKINDQDAGILWSVPFRVKAGKYLHPGKNKITVEVSNLMANRIRYMDQHGIEWRNFKEINFVNIRYRPFDASGWNVMKSGLVGPVKIIPLEKSSLLQEGNQ